MIHKYFIDHFVVVRDSVVVIVSFNKPVIQ